MLNFTSPGFPWQYPPNLDCQWYIFADNNMMIVLRIKSFDLERGFDYLITGNGEVTGEAETAKLTGDVKVRTITSDSSAMWILLETDNTGHMAGFHLQIEQVAFGDTSGNLFLVFDYSKHYRLSYDLKNSLG